LTELIPRWLLLLLLLLLFLLRIGLLRPLLLLLMLVLLQLINCCCKALICCWSVCTAAVAWGCFELLRCYKRVVHYFAVLFNQCCPVTAAACAALW
jgi:hypothetical protein